MNNTLVNFPPVGAYVCDKLPGIIALLGPVFLIKNDLIFRWVSKDGLATHCLQIGNTDNYIRLHSERSKDVLKKRRRLSVY
jgi:hypothetical protein